MMDEGLLPSLACGSVVVTNTGSSSMKFAAIFSSRKSRPNYRSVGRRRLPALEPLEGRALMALLTSVTFNPQGVEEVDVISFPPSFDGVGLHFNVYGPGYVPGTIPRNDRSGFGASASTAYDRNGLRVQDYVLDNGEAVQYSNGISTVLSLNNLGNVLGNVETMSVAFEPDNTGISDIVYQDGTYDEFTQGSNTPQKIATNVVSASVAIDPSGRKLQDYVTANGVLHEIDSANPGVTKTLGTNVVSGSVAFDGNDGIVRSVVFTDGHVYQYDYAGAHASGRVFTPAVQPFSGSSSTAFDNAGQEYAYVVRAFDAPAYRYNAYQIKNTGTVDLGANVLTINTAFSPRGKIIQDVVYLDGSDYEFIDGGPGTLIGHGVQSVSIAFDTQGREVADVVYQDGEYYEFDSTGGSTLIAKDVVSASVAIAKSGTKLQDYVTADGVAHEISGTTTTDLGTNVVSIGVAFDGNGGIVRTVVFTDGQAYQYDYAGQHSQGQVFVPAYQFPVYNAAPVNPNRLALIAKLPQVPYSIFYYNI